MEKKGLIYCPNEKNRHGFMTPHARLMGDYIRIWGGVRDDEGVSRLEYIDVDADNPSKILEIGKAPVLDIGADGTFDDNGVILGDVISCGNELWMYYVGFQHVQKVKFYAFTGLAISHDNGKSFKRFSEAPIMDRSNNARYARTIHTVIKENNIYKVWYVITNDFTYISGNPYSLYDIWYCESPDGITMPNDDNCRCITTIGNEYRIGRPSVYKTDDGYEMFYTRDTRSKEYLAGYATSKDGIHWIRDDENQRMLLRKSKTGFDSEMACYPVKLDYKDKTYVFYNGNGMGLGGVGYAIV